MPLKDNYGHDIIIHYRDGTSKIIGPYNFIIANFLAVTIALNPNVFIVTVTKVN